MLNITTVKIEDEVILSVQDNGVGIAANQHKNIFKMYRRLNDDVEGHGIELYPAKKIVDAAGGNIVVENEPGKGSTFIIYFKNLAIP